MVNEQLISLLTFAIVASITPGPNNFMLMSSGILFGFKKTMPHIIGIVLGFVSMLTAAVLGLAQLILMLPWLVIAIKIIGASWLSWMAFNYFLAASQLNKTHSKVATTQSRPFKFYEAFAFQWANPKGLITAVSCAGAFSGVSQDLSSRAFIIGSCFLLVGMGTCLLWTLIGNSLKRYMYNGTYAKALHIFMGVLILLTAIVIVFV
ncbi:LysE family translocator [Aliikangiella sp. IMCC44359]|uniref:LysE family translocator n=1 Tax=Aliikangiella sp. IMCC44359 TaxID=3459125 RepID=UPI00403B032C